MKKFVLDADSVIKLAKADVLGAVADHAICLMSKQVYDEIIKGKEKMYEDAFFTEKLVDSGKLKVLTITPEKTEKNLGLGERSTLAAFKKHKTDAIISDDTKFLSVLEKENKPFMISTDVITWLVERKLINKTEGLKALDNIRKLVKENAYKQAKKMIEGDEK